MTLDRESAIGHNSADLGTRTILTLTLVVALVVGLLASDAAVLPEHGSEPRVLHPLVTDGSGYLNNGYSDGAHVLVLPGNMVGISADASIAATRSAEGQIKGYRLRDASVAWEIGGRSSGAFQCEHWPISGSWSAPYWVGRGLAACWPQGAEMPLAVLDLGSGVWFELDFLNRYTEFDFMTIIDGSLFVTVLDHLRRESRVVRLDLYGNEISSFRVFVAGPTEGFDRARAGCHVVATQAICSRRPERGRWVFDLASGEPELYLDVDELTVRADGYVGSRADDSSLWYFNRAGQVVGSTRQSEVYTAKCDFHPDSGVLYSNADYLAQGPTCDRKLVGPTGRVMAENHHGDSFFIMTSARVRVGNADRSPFFGVTGNEKIVAVWPSKDYRFDGEGVRFFDPNTGRLIDSFPLPWADVDNGILYWDEEDVDPDNLLGTQVLAPGP